MLKFADSVPFGIAPNVNNYTAGIYQIGGLVTYNDGILGLEYKINNQVGGAYVAPLGTNLAEPSQILRHAFALDKLRDIALKSNIFGCRIIITANSLDLFEGVHGAINEKMILQIPRKEKKNAASFVSIVRADLSEFKLGRLSGE